MRFLIRSFLSLSLAIAVLLGSANNARADFGSAAITVALSTVGGAVLGASTLPFYDEPGEHTKNIFYGAALGAVGGVIISAYSGIEEGKEFQDEGRLHMRPRSQLSLNEAPEFRLRPESSVARRETLGKAPARYWAPLAKFSFN